VTDKTSAIRMVKGTIVISFEFCKGCELCVTFCPKHVISLSDRINAAGYPTATLINNGQCTGCAICALVCPEVAIEVYRE